MFEKYRLAYSNPYFLLLLFFLFFSSFRLEAQQKKLQVYYPEDTIEFDLIYHSTDSLSEGKLTAYFKEYPEIPAIEKNYYYGKQSGKYKAYYPSGRLMIYAIYQGGKLNGDWAYYGTDGSIRIKAQYMNGKRNGFYFDRVNKMQGKYKNGKRHGKWEFNTGSPAYRKVYYDKGEVTDNGGVLNQAKKAFLDMLPSKKIDSTHQLLDTLYDLLDTLYLPKVKDSDLIAHKIYYLPYDSLLHPKLRKAVFADNPKQVAVIKYLEGRVPIDRFQYFYPNGNIYQYGQYEDGKLKGDWKQYTFKGQLFIRGKYKEGKKNGKWMYNIGQDNFYTKKFKKGVLK